MGSPVIGKAAEPGAALPGQRPTDGEPLLTPSRPVLELARAGDGRAAQARVIAVLAPIEQPGAAMLEGRAAVPRGRAERAMATMEPLGEAFAESGTPGATARTLEAVVGARDAAGRFALATPLGAFVTLARDLGLVPGMRLLVQLTAGGMTRGVPIGAADRGSPSPVTAAAVAGGHAAPDAPALLSAASGLLARAPQLRLVLRGGAVASAGGPSPEPAVPAAAGTGNARPEGGAVPLGVADEAVASVPSTRAARVPAAGAAESSRAPGAAAGGSPAAEGHVPVPAARGGVAGRTSPAQGSATNIDTRGISARPTPPPAPDLGGVTVAAALPAIGDHAHGGMLGALPADGPTTMEAPRATHRGDVVGAGGGAALPPAPLAAASPTVPSGLHAVIERDERRPASRADGDRPGHVVIAVELGHLGRAELHLHWTDRALLVALAVADELPPELRGDLTAALRRLSAEASAGGSDGERTAGAPGR